MRQNIWYGGSSVVAVMPKLQRLSVWCTPSTVSAIVVTRRRSVFGHFSKMASVLPSASPGMWLAVAVLSSQQQGVGVPGAGAGLVLNELAVAGVPVHCSSGKASAQSCCFTDTLQPCKDAASSKSHCEWRRIQKS